MPHDPLWSKILALLGLGVFGVSLVFQPLWWLRPACTLLPYWLDDEFEQDLRSHIAPRVFIRGFGLLALMTMLTHCLSLLLERGAIDTPELQLMACGALARSTYLFGAAFSLYAAVSSLLFLIRPRAWLMSRWSWPGLICSTGGRKISSDAPIRFSMRLKASFVFFITSVAAPLLVAAAIDPPTFPCSF